MFGLGKKAVDLEKDGLREKITDALRSQPCPEICSDMVDGGILGDLRTDKGALINPKDEVMWQSLR